MAAGWSGYVDVTPGEVAALAHGLKVPDPVWVHSGWVSSDGAEPLEVKAGLRDKGIVKDAPGSDSPLVHAAVAHAIAAASLSRSVVVVATVSEDIEVHWGFADDHRVAWFSLVAGGSTLRLRLTPAESTLALIAHLTALDVEAPSSDTTLSLTAEQADALLAIAGVPERDAQGRSAGMSSEHWAALETLRALADVRASVVAAVSGDPGAGVRYRTQPWLKADGADHYLVGAGDGVTVQAVPGTDVLTRVRECLVAVSVGERDGPSSSHDEQTGAGDSWQSR